MNNYDIFITSNIPKPLPKKELLDCLKKISCGDSEAREKVIMHNMRLVFDRIYKKFYNVNYDKNELFSIGIIGLIKSIDTFNINKEIEFSVYAIRCIDNEILMFLRKLKKYSIEDSLESKIGENKDGNVLSLLDILADDYDFTEEYMKKELLISIRKIVDQLEGRDKEIIMLRFGFLDGKIYVQEEVATKLNISRSYVSRLEKKILKRIYNTLENNEYIDRIGLGFKVEENNVDEDENEMRKIQTIYQYFSEYTKEEIDLMVVKLNDRDRQLLKLRYGEDLENPQSIRLSGVESKKFYGSLVPKMKGLLTKIRQENYIPKELQSENKETIVAEETLPIDRENIDSSETSTGSSKVDIIKESQTIVSETRNTDMKKDDYIKILELLKTPTFERMMNMLSVKEAVIISLRLGYIDNKYFSTESIANFLGISSEEIRETTKKILLLYRENINSIIDHAISLTTDERPKRK